MCSNYKEIYRTVKDYFIEEGFAVKKRLIGAMLIFCLALGSLPMSIAYAADQQQLETMGEGEETGEVEEKDDLQGESAAKEENTAEEETTTEETGESISETVEEADEPEIESDAVEEKSYIVEKEKVHEAETGVSTLAGDEDYGDLSEYEIYLANEFIKYARYDFMTEDYNTGACGIYVRNGRENGLSTGIATWRALTFNGASEVSYAQAEVAYYEAILFDLVYDEKGGGMENTIYDDIMGASEAVKASNWKKICEGGQAALLNAPVSAENLDEIYSAVQQCESLKGILDKISSGTDILGYVDTGKEFLDKLSELSVLGSVSEETQEIITDMARAYTKADAMKAALDEYAILFTNLIDESTIINYLAGRTTLEQLSEECAKGLWSTVIGKMNSAGLAVEVGQTIGKMASNFLVSTDGIIETFYSMEAMTKFTEEFTKQVKTYGERFKAYPTVENAKRFNAAFEMLYKAQVINLDYAEKFLKQVNTEGFINYLFNGSEDEDYKSNLKSITNMKEDFSTYIDFKKASALSIYQELYPDNIETDFKDVVIEKPVSDEELAVIETEIETISEQIRDVTITEDTTFNANSEQYGDIILKDAVLDLNTHNMTIFGDLYIQGGTLKLNGGHLTVNGNVYHSDGLLYFSGGTLEASGNYCMGSENTDGTIVTSDGEIKMDNASDLLKVNGNIYLYCYSGADIQWTAGITEIGGNLYRYSSGAPGISGSHKTVFTGSQDLTISSEGWNGNLRLANVEILNTAVRKIIWKGNMEISESLTIDSERLEVNAEELNIQVTGWEGKPVKINGDVNYAGGFLDMSGCELEVTGNLNVTGGEINLNGGKLVCGKELLLGDNPNGLLNLNGGEGKIAGNVSHMDGTLYMNGGTLDVAGNYYMGSENTDGTIESSNGEIKMDNASDRLKVNGNIYLYCYSGAGIRWTAGITEIGGNLYRYSNGTTGISGSHKTVFTGSQDLTIESKGWNGSLKLANVEIQNALSRTVTFIGEIDISDSLKCDSEELRIAAQDAVLSGAGFSNLNLIVDGNLTYDSGTWSLNGKSLQVNGDIHQNGGILNLGKGNLTVIGSYYHQEGTLNPAGGAVKIGGNYYNAVLDTDSSSGDTIFGIASGILYMNHTASSMDVAGDFVMASDEWHSNKLTAGTIAIQGNFTQISGNEYNFACGESLKVILNGKDVQHVSFESNQSKFNILQITKDKNTGYVFSPDPCWNELEEIQNEFAVLVQPEDCAVGEGETAGFMTKASGEDLTYQWQYCDPESDQWKDVQSEGSRTDTLSVKVTSDMDGQRYRCIIKNGEGKSLVTEEAVLNIKYELTILQQPSDFSGREGDTALFTVTAAGYQVTYQWQYQNAGSQEWKNSSMAGSRSSTLVVPVTGSRNGQKYRCVLTDGDGKRLVTEETVLRTKTENPFTDVIQGQYYYEPILWAYENGIASGLSEDKFGPDETCTRAQVVIFLWRAKGQPEALIQELPFEDVSKGAYYYEAVAWAYENQIVSGIDATHFKPDDTVSRGQFVTFLYRAEGKPGYTTENPFTDVTKDSYYYDSVLWAYEKGVASGLSSDRFGIDEQCTRGQVATFLYRAYN